MLRVLTWNIAGRQKRQREQLNFISDIKPDIVTLQEVTAKTVDGLRAEFDASGFQFIADSLSLSDNTEDLTGPRRYGQIIASRLPGSTFDPKEFDVPWKERVLSSRLFAGGIDIEVHTTHVPPGSSNGWVKVETFEGIFKRLAIKHQGHRLLTGDFNSPNIEFADGRNLVFGERERKGGEIVATRKKDPSNPTRWRDAERSVLYGLKEFGLEDAYLSLHGSEKVETSWRLPQNPKIGRRFDHIFSSPQLVPVKAEYIHWVREEKLSDHSAHTAEFEVRKPEVAESEPALPKLIDFYGSGVTEDEFGSGQYLFKLCRNENGQFALFYDNGKDMRVWHLGMSSERLDEVREILSNAIDEFTPLPHQIALDALKKVGITSREIGW